MSNRERWIVYPLLFYALVMGFKATYQDPVEFRCQTIECQQLRVGMINGSPAVSALGNFILLEGQADAGPSEPASTNETDAAPPSSTAPSLPSLDAGATRAAEPNEEPNVEPADEPDPAEPPTD